jgi:hypothetical protein
MALMKERWAAALTDCSVLEREIDLAIQDGQPERAREGLQELSHLVTLWSLRIMELKHVCEEREYTGGVVDCESYIHCFRSWSSAGRERLKQVLVLEGQ